MQYCATQPKLTYLNLKYTKLTYPNLTKCNPTPPTLTYHKLTVNDSSPISVLNSCLSINFKMLCYLDVSKLIDENVRFVIFCNLLPIFPEIHYEESFLKI